MGLCAYGWVGVVSGLRVWVGVGGCERGLGMCVSERESRRSMGWCMCGVVCLWLGWSCEGEWVACVGGCWWVREKVGCVCER